MVGARSREISFRIYIHTSRVKLLPCIKMTATCNESEPSPRAPVQGEREMSPNTTIATHIDTMTDYAYVQFICEIAIRVEGGLLKYVPDQYKSAKLCKLAVQNNGYALKFVPPKFRDEKLCMTAVQRCGRALVHVHSAVQTINMRIRAVQNDGLALKYISSSRCSAELCLMAVQNNGLALEYVPQGLRTLEICTTAVQNNYNAISMVPESIRASVSSTCHAAARNAPLFDMILQRSNECSPTLTARRHNPLNIQSLTLEWCVDAVEHDGCALEFVPEHFRTRELCLKAVQNNPMALIIFVRCSRHVKNSQQMTLPATPLPTPLSSRWDKCRTAPESPP